MNKEQSTFISMSQWAELNCDLVSAISKHLKSYVDYVRFGAVCSSWNSALPKRPTHLFNQIPWLMLPFDDGTETYRSFYSILDDKIYQLELSETRGKWFRGSCYGWLVTVEMSPGLHLFNPLTKSQIALPPLHSFPDIEQYCPGRNGREYAIHNYRFDDRTEFYSQAHMQEVYINKLVLSSPPHDDYLAIAIFGEFRRLAFCSRIDEKWTVAETCGEICFVDVIFYEDKIYALTIDGRLLTSSASSMPSFTFIPVELPNFEIQCKLYLVGSNNGLMMVERYYMWGEELDSGVITYKTSGFKIYTLESNLGEEMLKWSEIKHLGDNVMFLGYNASILIPSIDFPKLKGNCVYYTDDQMELWRVDYGGFDIGFFDLDEGVIKEFGELNLSSGYVWPPPVCVMPNP